MKYCFFLIFVFLGIISCESNHDKAYQVVLEMQDKLMKVQDVSVNKDLAIEMLNTYSLFVETYSNSKNNPEILFNSGKIYLGLGSYLKSAEFFYQVHSIYPDSKWAPLALFHQAYCFEALEQRLTAKNSYVEFIARYPHHPYVHQANGMIQLLQFTDEELINQFNK